MSAGDRGAGMPTVTIVGAGLCGSLLAIMLRRRNFRVTVLERRPDPRDTPPAAGRSINLALSSRGIRALQAAGVFPKVEPLLMPMRGRCIHAEDGSSNLLPYGQKADEQIYSVSRAGLNHILIDVAEREADASMRFEQEATALELAGRQLHVNDRQRGDEYRLQACPVIAADGAGSAIRRSMAAASSVAVTESLLPHGYRELSIPAAPGGRPQLDPGALHIWPRGEFMLIALPNPGGDFTLTLFLPNEGRESFAALDTPAATEAFFARYFADAVPLIDDLVQTFLQNPVGILGTVRCQSWFDEGNLLLIGDAAHAIVPFHGQGMNLAFDDCLLLDQILDRGVRDWAQLFAQFERQQHVNADAIADMALENYVEMRDSVRDAGFKLRKELSFELERRLPEIFIPRYSMVMFHPEISYALAQERGGVQEELLSALTRDAATLGDIDLDQAADAVRERLPPLPALSR